MFGLSRVRPHIIRAVAVWQAMLDTPFPATERPRCEQRAIDADIFLCHPRGGEALFEALTHLVPVERDDSRQRRDCLLHSIDDGAGEAILDDLWHRAAAERQNRGSA